jgi:hypothetical protein
MFKTTPRSGSRQDVYDRIGLGHEVHRTSRPCLPGARLQEAGCRQGQVLDALPAATPRQEKNRMTRRTPAEIAAALDARSAKLKEESERRRSVASDPICSWLYDSECALHRVRLATTEDTLRAVVSNMTEDLKTIRQARWKRIREDLKS